MRCRAQTLVVLCSVLCSTAGQALPPAKAQKAVVAARSLKGVPFTAGGRLQSRGEGTDGLGVVLHAAQAVSGCGWSSFPAQAAGLLKKKELGTPAFGKKPLALAAVPMDRLQLGDTVLLVGPTPSPDGVKVARQQGQDLFVQDVGLYTGDGLWVVGDPRATAIQEVSLQQYLRERGADVSGVLVLRMKAGPRPARCKHHPPMDRQKAGL